MKTIFSGMKAVDWVLAVGFAALLTYSINRMFPPSGWAIGLVLSLVLLYIAKRKRDGLSGGK